MPFRLRSPTDSDPVTGVPVITVHPGGIEGDVSALSGLLAAPQRPGTLTVPGVTEAQREISRIPGSVAVVPTARYEDTYAHNLEDVMDFTPGVYARKRFGAEVRLSVRGSGLSRNFHMRGLEILQDSVPFNLADGAADFQEIDPLIAQHIEVYKGGNGLRFGSSTLGGAINIVTPTAWTAPAANLVRIEGGSYGSARIHAQAARVYGTTDIYAAMTGNHVDGFRAQEKEESIRFSANLGHRFNDRAETRFYVISNTVDQELPGTLTLQQARQTPEMANPANVAGNQQRNVRSIRVANKTALDLGDGAKLEFGGYGGYKRLYHPIFRVLDQRGPVAGLFARYRDEGTLAGHRNVLTVGSDVSWGEVDAKQYANLAGSRGALLASGKQESGHAAAAARSAFSDISPSRLSVARDHVMSALQICSARISASKWLALLASHARTPRGTLPPTRRPSPMCRAATNRRPFPNWCRAAFSGSCRSIRNAASPPRSERAAQRRPSPGI